MELVRLRSERESSPCRTGLPICEPNRLLTALTVTCWSILPPGNRNSRRVMLSLVLPWVFSILATSEALNWCQVQFRIENVGQR